MASLNLDSKEVEEPVDEPPPKMSLAREKVLEEARKELDASAKKAVNLVVIGEYICPLEFLVSYSATTFQGMLTLESPP